MSASSSFKSITPTSIGPPSNGSDNESTTITMASDSNNAKSVDMACNEAPSDESGDPARHPRTLTVDEDFIKVLALVKELNLICVF